MKDIREKAEGGGEEPQELTQAETQGLASVPAEKEGGKEKKRCRKCGEVKPLKEFAKNKIMKDGHENKCKVCKGEMAKTLRRERKAITKTQGLAPVPEAKNLTSPRDDGKIKTTLVIDFTEHIDVLEKITKDASANFRTPELQALFLLAGKGDDYDR